MGVSGLESYLHRSKKACQSVSIKEISNEFRRTTGRTPVIVMDGLSCLRPLYGKLNWICGGQFKEFYSQIKKFLNNVRDLGCELVVFFEGPHDNWALDLWKEKKISIAKQIQSMLKKRPVVPRYGNILCLPNGLENVFLFTLSEYDNCKVFNATSETDYEVAKYAFDNECFALLAQDTDYVIFRAAKYYLSMKHLNIDTMTTVCYDWRSLTYQLRMDNRLLPLFASLLGNDIVNTQSLKKFHNKIRGKNDKVECVAAFINKNIRYGFDVQQVSVLVFGSENMHQVLQASINFYDLKRKNSSSSCKLERGNWRDSNWNRILMEVKIKLSKDYCSTPLFDIIFLQKYYSANVLEDYQSTTPKVADILRELRCYAYGILLHENPQNVNELVMADEDSIKDYKLIQPKYLHEVEHPGLLALWNKKNGVHPKDIQEIRWKILGEIFKKSDESIKNLPPSLLIPALSVRYFLNQRCYINNEELNAIIASYVCFKNYSVEKLSKLEERITNSRAVWLYSVLGRIHMFVHYILYFIGGPIPYEQTLAHNYTDGKLFHVKYRQSLMTELCRAETLCENNEETLQQFNMIKTFVGENTRELWRHSLV